MRYPKKLMQMFLALKQESYEHFSQFHHMDNLPGPNVLVFSPHPDDDIFGCGGSLITHVKQGHSIHIIYFCKGDKGIHKLSGNQAAEVRKSEAISACAIIGISEENLTFLNQGDHDLSVNKQLISKVNEILEHVNPDIIYLPTFTDNHPDHFQVNLILKASNVVSRYIAGYEIWTPHIPNRLVDITPVIDQKIKAIQAHKSQINEMDYLNAILALNKYRACLYAKKKFSYAESFLILETKEYLNLIRPYTF